MEKRVKIILNILSGEFPEARTALICKTPFQLMVAAILSAQCTDERVNRVTGRLFARWPGPEDFARLSREALEEEIRSCGLFRNKARNIIAAARDIVEKYGGKIPEDFDELRKLPGVGRKTANVILSCAFGKPALAVDTHVHRVANRLGLAQSKKPEETEKQLKGKIPRREWSDAHHRFIFHGRTYCRARKPFCSDCPLKEECAWEEREK